MTAFLPCTAAFVPLFWLAASLLATRTDDYRQRRARVASGVGGVLALAAAVMALVALIRVAPTTVSVPGAAALLSLRIDAISVTMALLIAFVGLVVVRFSHGYLGGDPRQAAFLRFLCETLAAVVGLGAILVFGAMHLIIQSSREGGTPGLLLRVGFTATAVAGLYFTLQAAAAMVFENTVPAAGALDPVQLGLMTVMLLTFGTVTALQWYLPAVRRSPRWHAFWVHLVNGFYVNQLINQFIALRDDNARASH